MQECKFHPVDRVKISLANTLYCSLCMCQVDDFRKITCECNDYEQDPDEQHDDCETDEK